MRCLLFVLFFLAVPPAFADSLIDRVQKMENSIVEVRTELVKPMRSDESGKTVKMATFARTGVGIIIDPSGLIVTNTHTIVNAPRIYVIFKNGTKVEAQAVHVGEGYDFSFIRITPPFKLKAITWAESAFANLDDKIVAVGRSELNHETILGGKITGLIQSKTTGHIELIEVNLNLYRGDSGGPIIDSKGHLLGIVMGRQKSQDGKSYAIASDKIREQYLIYRRNMQ